MFSCVTFRMALANIYANHAEHQEEGEVTFELQDLRKQWNTITLINTWLSPFMWWCIRPGSMSSASRRELARPATDDVTNAESASKMRSQGSWDNLSGICSAFLEQRARFRPPAWLNPNLAVVTVDMNDVANVATWTLYNVWPCTCVAWTL